MNQSNCPLLDEIAMMSPTEVTAGISDLGLSQTAFHQVEEALSVQAPISQAHVKEWLDWCRDNAKVKVTTNTVPPGILPMGFSGILHDVKVMGGFKSGHGPDDKIYNSCPDIRDKVARGNTVLELDQQGPDGESSVHDMVVFALRKFTGGMGDEDEEQPDDDQVWQRYFSAPLDQVDKVVCMVKENGEAAHISARSIGGEFYFVAGSKNVHLLFKTREHLELYKDTRYMVAKTVAIAWLDQVALMDVPKLALLLSFLDQTKLTAIFEILLPSYQHVVDLSHLSQPQLRFLALTNRYSSDTSSLAAIPPDAAIDLAKSLGLETAKYDLISGDEAEARMVTVRAGYGYEGEVLYFLDKNQVTVGLLKKKTSWYVLCRAIREKASHTLTTFKKNPDEFSNQLNNAHLAKIDKRVSEIQRWLSLSDSVTKQWKNLGGNFQNWMISLLKRNIKNVENISVRGNFPQMWKQFLEETSSSDKIDGDTVEEPETVNIPMEIVEQSIFILEEPSISSVRVTVTPEVVTIRPHIAVCIVRDVDLLGRNLNKLKTCLNKTNSRQCRFRGVAFVGLHDLDRLKGGLVYTVGDPAITPVDGEGKHTVNSLLENCKDSEVVKYQHLLVNKEQFPFIRDEDNVISIPPLTNCEETRLREETVNILVEVTSRQGKETVEFVLTSLLKQMFHLGLSIDHREKFIRIEKGVVVHSDGTETSHPLDFCV